MTNLDRKKIELELMRVTTARFELELKVEERLAEIERLKEHIKVQSDKEIDLKKKIKE